MRKAFLCHSSKDKDYVRVVATRLGRAKVVYDAISFEPGEDFREAIAKGLDTSALFVFVVSDHSLKSLWCKYEIDEAHFRKIMGKLEGHLCIIIDQGVSFNDLPHWMQRSRAVLQPRPSQATRDIQHALLSFLAPQSIRPFVGRQTLQKEFVVRFSDLALGTPTQLNVSGLENIGRRTYLERVAHDNLGLNLGPVFLLDETRDLDDLYLWALDETADLGTRANMAAEIEGFAKLPEASKITEIVNRLRVLCKDNCLPCILDTGGMLDDIGSYKSEFVGMLAEFSTTPDDYYLAVIHRRTPYLGGGLPFAQYTFHQRVPPLDDSEAKLLLQQLCRRYNLKLDSTSANEIVEYLGGHPPSVYFTASFAQTYGIANLIADKSTLVDFKAKIFTRFIADLRLGELDWLVLRYLSSEKTIPLAAISAALEKPADDIALSLRTLIDHCLLVLVDDNYGVASPIRDAVFRVKGHLGIDDYTKVCANLTRVFWSDLDAGPSIEVIDATLHAVARTGSTDFKPYENLVRPSIVHRLAKECYHRKEWAEAIEYARRAEAMDKKRKEPRQIHFKALVQLGRWEEATAKLAEIEKTRDRTHFYLKGFLHKKREQHNDAIRAFESAIKSGDRGNAVYRDYADCLYRCDRFDDAIKSINEVLRRDPENVFVLDLVARICIDGGFKELLGATLQKLERYDIDKRFVYHRKATHYCAIGCPFGQSHS
jgi:tetratricopeptide (TPR) repeat protein